MNFSFMWHAENWSWKEQKFGMIVKVNLSLLLNRFWWKRPEHQDLGVIHKWRYPKGGSRGYKKVIWGDFRARTRMINGGKDSQKVRNQLLFYLVGIGRKIVDIIYRWPITKLYTLKISKKIRLIQGFDVNCYWKIQKDRHKYFKWRLFFESCLWNTYVLTSKILQIYFLFQSFE